MAWGNWPQPIGSYRTAQPGRASRNMSWPQPISAPGAQQEGEGDAAPRFEDTGGGNFTGSAGGFMSPPSGQSQLSQMASQTATSAPTLQRYGTQAEALAAMGYSPSGQQIGDPSRGQRAAQMSQPEPRPQYQPPQPSMPQRRGALYTMGMPSGPAAMIPRGGGPVMSTSSLLDGSNPLVQLLRAAMAQYGGAPNAGPYGGGYQPLQSAAGTGGYVSDYAPGGSGGNGASATGYLAAPGGGSGLTNPFTGAPVSSYPIAPSYPGMGFTSELIPPAGAATPQTPWYAQPGGPGANPWATDPTLTMNQDQTAMTRSW